MKNTRRKFLKNSASLAALSTVGFSPLMGCKSNRRVKKQDDGPFEWMKLSVAHWGINNNPRRVQLCKMMGVTGAVSGGGRDIKAAARAFSNIGLEWTVLEGVSQPRVHLGLEGRDEELERLRGIQRILTSFDNLKRFVNMYSSPYNGITFYQGCFSSMGPEIDMPNCIRWFRERGLIHFVHFRDTRGTPDNFRETWHDDGPNDMYEAMKAYYEVGFNGPIRPDHVPSITGYEDVGGGYTDLGLLFAIGYMKGLMKAVYKGS